MFWYTSGLNSDFVQFNIFSVSGPLAHCTIWDGYNLQTMNGPKGQCKPTMPFIGSGKPVLAPGPNTNLGGDWANIAVVKLN